MPTPPLVQTLADLGEALAIGIVPHICVGPMDREMRYQGTVDQFCKFDCLDETGGLVQGDALARAWLPLGFLRCMLIRRWRWQH